MYMCMDLSVCLSVILNYPCITTVDQPHLEEEETDCESVLSGSPPTEHGMSGSDVIHEVGVYSLILQLFKNGQLCIFICECIAFNQITLHFQLKAWHIKIT